MGINSKFNIKMNGYTPLRKSNDIGSLLLFFVIWPFGAFLSTLKDIKSRKFLIAYVLFCILLCWNMDVNKNAGYDDLSGMASLFQSLDHSSAAFFKRLHDYITFSPDAPREIYTYFMMWLSHLITPNPHFFFALSSIPYLFFQVKCFKMFLEDDRFVSGAIGVLIIFLFMFPRDIVTCQNPRFNIALWVCIYVIMKSFHPLTTNNKHLLWLLVTPLIHSSYWFLTPVIIGGIIIAKAGVGEILLTTLVYISIPFSYMGTELGQSLDISSLLPIPDTLNSWASTYLHREQDVVSWGNSGFYWVPILFDFIKTTAYLIIPIAILSKKKKLMSSPATKKLFLFYLFLFSFANFVQLIPVINTRAVLFIHILSIYMIFRVYGMNSKLYFLILFASAWSIFSRYYGGVFERSVPYIIFYTPMPYILYEYWGVTHMDVQLSDGIDIESYL